MTHAMTADLFLRGQLAFLRERGWQVGIAASPGPRLATIAVREGCSVFGVPMQREIAPLSDLRALMKLWGVVRRFAPDVVVSSTPKAGLIGTLAARGAGVTVRVYLVRGLRLETVRGWRRLVLRIAERCAVRNSTHLAFVSESLRACHVQLGLSSAPRSVVVGPGSSNGVDTRRYAPGAEPAAETAPVVGFVGRLTHDKGIADLARAFATLRRLIPGTRLLLVGAFESGDPVEASLRRALLGSADVEITGFVEDSAPYYRQMNVLAFPSAREGFPNAPLEAAASGVPTVGYRVTGMVDAVLDGRTGTLVDPGDVDGLARAIAEYLRDPRLRRLRGEAARQRVVRVFDSTLVWTAWEAYYAGLLAARRASPRYAPEPRQH